jgi:hypothetical protein
MNLYREPIPLPRTWDDDYATRTSSARRAAMRIAEHLNLADLKRPPPPGLSYEDEALWKYQRYMRDYLQTIQAIDDSVGTLLDWLDAKGLAENTVVVYTSDQGFFLGDHGWFDKRFIHGWRVGSIRRSSIRLGMIDVNFVAVNDPKHVLTIRDVSMGLPSNKDDYGLLSRWSITDQTGFNSSSEHPISLLMEGNAGEWLITNPATGSQFVGSGESDPPDGFFARS